MNVNEPDFLSWGARFGLAPRDVVAPDGTLLSVLVGGAARGRRVVLLHGAPQCGYTWRRVVAALADRYALVVPDLRGYGASDLAASGRYDLETLTGDLGAILAATARGADDPALLVGHDWGGVIAWSFAERSPREIRHLVAVNGPHPGAFARELPTLRQATRSWYMGLFQLPGLERVLERTRSGLLVWMIRASSPRSAIDVRDLALYRAALARPGRAEAVLAYYRQSLRPKPGETLLGNRRRELARPRIDVPATIVWGEADLCLAPTHPDEVHRFAARLEVRRLPGASHWVPEERPEEVVSAIVDGDAAG